MANENKLELVVEIDPNKPNASIKSINTGLSSMEQAAVNAARGGASGMDALAISVAKGAAAAELLVGAFTRAVGAVKEYITESALLAARNETLAVVNAQLGRANGYSAESIERLVEKVKGLGITTQSSRDAVNQMIAAQIDLSKATELGRMAQDAAVVSGQNSSEALLGILHGITTQQIEVLRTYGINVQFERVFQEARIRLNRDLTDSERKNLAFQEVLKQAPKIAGAYEASMGTAGKQMASLARYVEEAKSAIGERFLPELRQLVTLLTESAKWAKENADGIATFAKGLGVVASAAILGQFLSYMSQAKVAVMGLNAAMLANPWTAVAAGAALVGFAVYENLGKLEKQYAATNKPLSTTKEILDAIGAGKSADQLKAAGYSLEQIRAAVGGIADAGKNDALDFQSRIKLVNSKEIEELKKMEAIVLGREISKRQVEARKAAGEELIKAGEVLKDAEREQAKSRIDDALKVIQSTQSETDASKKALDIQFLQLQEHAAGVAKIREQETLDIAKQSSFVDEKGALRTFTLSSGALGLIHQATALKIAAFDLKFNEEESRRMEEIWKALGERIKQNFERDVLTPMEAQIDFWQQLTDIGTRRTDNTLGYDKQAIQQRKDLQIANIESINAITIKDKIYVEQQKTAIEVDAIQKRTAVELIEIDRRTDAEIRAAQNVLRAKGILDDARLGKVAEDMRDLGKEEKEALRQSTKSEIDVLHVKGATQTRQIVTSEYRNIFDSLKQQAGGVFDALLTKSQSIWSAIGNSLKTALLTAIKDVVSSRIAIALMNMFVPGSNARMVQGGIGSSMFGGLGGLLGIGSQIAFGGGGGIPGMAGIGQLGATPPFMADGFSFPGFGGAAPAAAGGSGGVGGLASYGAMFAGYKSLLSKIGNFGTGNAANSNATGVGGNMGGAMLLGGAALGIDGLRRGGLFGLAETTGGGALIGAKFGGPLGAGIGAGIGALAGIIRLFIKGAEEKLHSKIKEVYGIDVADREFLRSILDLAKQSHGGNLDLAIRSNQVRDWLMYYKMQTNQATAGLSAIDNSARGVSLSGYGGAVSQNNVFVGGAGYNYGGTIAPTTPSKTFQPQAPTTLILQIDGRDVNASVQRANTGSSGRRESAAILLDPLLTYG